MRPYGTFLFRAAGSAGGRFPLEVYVAVPEGHELPAGVHWYHPQEHVLMRVGPAPRAGVPTVVVTGVPWRTGWRYRERGYRHIYWDAGTMLSQLLAAAQSGGTTPGLITRFPDEQLTALVGADGVHEWPVAVVTLGDGQAAVEPTGTAITGEVDANPVEFPLVTWAQRAGDLGDLGEAWETGGAVAITSDETGPVEEVVLASGSQRLMDAAHGVSRELLETAMRVALRGIDLPHFIVVHDVEGLASGVYRWPHLTAPRKTGVSREELYRICLDQDLGRDAAFITFGVTEVHSLDDREYREVQLAAGLIEGRLHLIAYGLGASATGMTFLDSEIPSLTGEVLDALMFTCVGVPEYRSAVGGQPGKPTAVRRVMPRMSDNKGTS